jgi:hypothetical protein
MTHSGPEGEVHHAGDLGNIIANSEGINNFTRQLLTDLECGFFIFVLLSVGVAEATIVDNQVTSTN